jgi:hypothetical protein
MTSREDWENNRLSPLRADHGSALSTPTPRVTCMHPSVEPQTLPAPRRPLQQARATTLPSVSTLLPTAGAFLHPQNQQTLPFPAQRPPPLTTYHTPSSCSWGGAECLGGDRPQSGLSGGELGVPCGAPTLPLNAQDHQAHQMMLRQVPSEPPPAAGDPMFDGLSANRHVPSALQPSQGPSATENERDLSLLRARDRFPCPYPGCSACFCRPSELWVCAQRAGALFRALLTLHDIFRRARWFGRADKVLCRKSYLPAHMNLHTGSRPFQCQVLWCRRAFRWKSNLTRHSRIVHR